MSETTDPTAGERHGEDVNDYSMCVCGRPMHAAAEPDAGDVETLPRPRYVPWECSCGIKADAWPDTLIRCTCGRVTRSAP